jgi:copper(I)-binding protein
MEMLMFRTSLATIVFLTTASISSASAQSTKIGDLRIEHPWSRATPAGAKVAAGYLTITNTGTNPDRLVGGSYANASKVEVHEMAMNDHVMRMRPLQGGLLIEPGKSVTLAPSGYHLMFVDLKSPLKQGSKITATLQFEKAGNIDVTFDVRGVGARAPESGSADHDHGPMQDHGMPGHKM